MSEAASALALRLLAPLDAVRSRLLRALVPLARPVFGDRSRRIAWYGVFGVLTALALSVCAPLLLLTVGPLLLGVPHLVADVRYLIVRQDLAQRTGLQLVVLPWLGLAIALPELRWGLCAVAAAALCARAPWALRVLAALLCLFAAAWAHASHGRAELWFAHAHNLIALGIWALFARKRQQELLPALVFFVLASGVLFSGVLEPLLIRAGGLTPGRFSIDMNDWVTRLSPVSPVRDPIWGMRAVLFFAFAQSLHYAVWLRLIPETDRPRAGLRSFSSSYRALEAELGSGMIFGAALVVLGLLLCAMFRARTAYDGYVRLATFHGPLELAVLVVLALERTALRRAA